MFTKTLKIKLITLLAVSVIIITTANIFVGYLFLPGNLEQDKIIIIKPDSSIKKISDILEKEGVITNSWLFEIICSVYSRYYSFKSGEYKFTSYTSPYQIIKILTNGKSLIHKLFIPEGLMVSEIIEIVNSQTRLKGRINSNIPEGYLMPSTYYYSYGDHREKIIDMMRKKLSLALDEAMLKLSEDSPLKTRKEVLTLASIIEKEAGNNEERKKIASVFINRLKKGMRLQADPTTIYAITEGKYKLRRPLRTSDLKIQSPYNTYRIYGLPKGPIACAGAASIEAAVAPEKTDFLYFVVNGNGGHNFAKTLSEHNKNVQNFRKNKNNKT